MSADQPVTLTEQEVTALDWAGFTYAAARLTVAEIVAAREAAAFEHGRQDLADQVRGPLAGLADEWANVDGGWDEAAGQQEADGERLRTLLDDLLPPRQEPHASTIPAWRETLARVWDEARESLGRDMASPVGEDGMRRSTPNPYRAVPSNPQNAEESPDA